MIKRYILHIETHWRHLPRISFKRAPRSGDRVKDGGVWGTLRQCPTCEEGFLHEPDRRKTKSKVLPPGPHKWLGGYCVDCENSALFCPYPPAVRRPPLLGVIAAELAKNIQTGRSSRVRPARSYHTPRPAMDFNAPSHVDLKVTGPKPAPRASDVEIKIVPPAQHVELKADDAPEHVELKVEKPAERVELKLEEESPEELKLDYELGTRKYKAGEVIWTHKAEYVVESLTKKVLHLVRKDVWDERQKKTEHVELKVEDEKPSEIVQLKFE